jgi:hypothetical protein
MSNRKLAQAIRNLTREMQILYRNLNRLAVKWLLRWAFVSHRQSRSPVAGFVIPTVVLLLLVVTLSVGAMTLRAFDRNVQVIANAQEKVIYNAATPAIDRARSKLEYLFNISADTRYPGGTPQESFLLGMLTNDGGTYGGIEVQPLPFTDSSGKLVDPYTLPDETKIDIGSPTGDKPDGNALNDTTWSYRADTDGDGKSDATVIYSVIFKTPPAKGNETAPSRFLTMTDQEKAAELIVRSGPISAQTSLTGCGNSSGDNSSGFTSEAWFQDQGNSSTIRKNFQVDAIVVPDKAKAATVTLEFQQDRQVQRGNKWGAWFRYDLEIFPGPKFNWNGAMHTEGNLMVGGVNGPSLTAYLISSPKSCLYQVENSEISITDLKDGNDLGRFNGQAIAGMIAGAARDSNKAVIHVQTSDTQPPITPDLVSGTDTSSTATADAIASDPVSITLYEKTQSVNPANEADNSATKDWKKAGFIGAQLDKRIFNKAEKIPFVDDLYRADDRWGPKPKYDDAAGGRLPAGVVVGTEIDPAKKNRLVANAPATGLSTTSVGLDGYWERRARGEGLRILVGERLELGNIGGWVAPRDVDLDKYIAAPTVTGGTAPDLGPNTELPGDPLYPPTLEPYPVAPGTPVPHLTQQRRSLRDNLSAVQSAAVYHAAVGNSKDYPVACLAMTIHPGTASTIRQSSNFFPTAFKPGQSAAAPYEYLLSDFFTGRGTDGWEYETPGADEAAFKSKLAAGAPLRIALDNLANFAGDPDGAFPPKQDDVIHPYPALSMWGNYSNLRRALRLMGPSNAGYDNLSPADKTYLQTAACTLGLLAKNVDTIQKFDPTNFANDAKLNGSTEVLANLSVEMALLIDGDVNNGDVLSKSQLATYKYDPNQSAPSGADYKASDYYNVPPEAYIAALKQKVLSEGRDYLNDPVVRMAEMIMLSHQIRRDRTFGFRPSPAFGEYSMFYSGKVHTFPTACDPDLFTFGSAKIKDNLYTIGTPISGSPKQTSIQTPSGTNWGFKPFGAEGATYTVEDNLPGAVLGDLKTLAGSRLALSRLCGAISVPSDYKPGALETVRGDAATATFKPASRPTVLPKFPSLYYIFPEVAHGVKGALVSSGTAAVVDPGNNIANSAGEWDHRQPGAIALNGAASDINPAVGSADYAAVALAGVNPRDREPYVVDAYVNRAGVSGNYSFTPIPSAAPTGRLAPYPIPAGTALNPSILPNGEAPLASVFARQPYAGSTPFPAADLSVSAIALEPRRMGEFPSGAAPAVLPNYAPKGDPTNLSPNRIQIPSATPETTVVAKLTDIKVDAQANYSPTKPWAIPFLDRAMFDTRELEVDRVTDIDLGMLRSTSPASASQTAGQTAFAGNEPWLPMSGIVYAFREDAVREDAIARPNGSKSTVKTQITNVTALTPGTAMDLTDLANPSDPKLQANNISIKPIDFLPDPDRRTHGFRLRNGAQLKRNPSIVAGIEKADTKNVRGLSFFTDQPTYIVGDFNLHQEGDGNTDNIGTRLEEFEQKLPTNSTLPEGYSFDDFYGRTTRDTKFAILTEDRWRPSEILADGIGFLSPNFCDGSIDDAFVKLKSSIDSIPSFDVDGTKLKKSAQMERRTYNAGGIFGPACPGDGSTSYTNQNRPLDDLPDNWEWKREGGSFVTGAAAKTTRSWSDFTTPIQIGRLGEPLLINRPSGNNATTPKQAVNYGINGLGLKYIPYGSVDLRDRGQSVEASAAGTRVNSIIVSGIVPSRKGQSYGGLQNFPRFIENWKDSYPSFFAGSFIQLNFSNYATAPFEQEGWEPSTSDTLSPGETRPRHYVPPRRRWGYDVGLLFAPAGPAAERFVTPSTTRSEFYTEPPLTDPYINNLCTAAKKIPGIGPVNCPGQVAN